MSKIWFWMIIISTFSLIYTNPSNVVGVMVNASGSAFSLCIELVGIYALWMGILEILEKCGINDLLAKILSPIIKKLFKGTTKEAQRAISINLSANFLGLGNAATPSGIDAMQKMDNRTGVATKQMILFMVINTTAIQLFPTTVVGIRAAAGSTNPSDIFLPTLFTSVISTLLGIGICLLINFLTKKRKRL
ncbi:MAG: nucleoside recognition domain-containing protein [Clostridia bacterium]